MYIVILHNETDSRKAIFIYNETLAVHSFYSKMYFLLIQPKLPALFFVYRVNMEGKNSFQRIRLYPGKCTHRINDFT